MATSKSGSKTTSTKTTSNKSTSNYWPVTSKKNSNWTTTYSDAHWSWTLNSSWQLVSSSLNAWYSSNAPKNVNVAAGSTKNANWTYSSWWSWWTSTWQYGTITSKKNSNWTTTYSDAHGTWTLNSQWQLVSSTLNPWYSSTLSWNTNIATGSVRNADWTVSSWTKNNNINLSNMKFWKDVYSSWWSYDLGWRNQQIVDIMKKNWIQATDAKSVQDFLEMYAPSSYSSADDDDKIKTADKIYKLYNWIPEFEPDNESPLGDEDNFDLDKTLQEEWWDDLANQDEEEVIQEPDERDELIKQLQEENLRYKEKEADELEKGLDELSNQEEEKKWLSDEQKAANEAASAAAWNSAQWINNTETTEPTNISTNEQPVVNSENYWDRWTKIMNVLWNLWYKINTAPSEEAAEAETSNILEWWEATEPADVQAQIAESNATEWEVTPEYTDEAWLVSSYEKAFDDLLAWWTTPENIQKAVETYLQAKDAAALFTVQNNLSDDAFKNMLKKIKWNKSLRTLLQNYNK